MGLLTSATQVSSLQLGRQGRFSRLVAWPVAPAARSDAETWMGSSLSAKSKLKRRILVKLLVVALVVLNKAIYGTQDYFLAEAKNRVSEPNVVVYKYTKRHGCYI